MTYNKNEMSSFFRENEFPHTSRRLHPEPSVIDVGNVRVGGGRLAMIAGPCAVESYEQLLRIANDVKAAGANLLRGGAFKPRTSPYDFQGLGREGIEILYSVKKETSLPVVSEITSVYDLELFDEKVDLIQVGARSMQNYDLLRHLGQSKRPVLLKRGMSATYEEWILSAEYIMESGNPNVIFCERGIRTFECYTRNTLDLQSIPVLKSATHLPVIADPSHAGGRWRLVEPMAKAAVSAGADGLMIEVHYDPKNALSDGAQSLHPDKYNELLKELRKFACAAGREL